MSIAFEVPENLKQEFCFEQGQNITIRKTIGGEELRRSYSICTALEMNYASRSKGGRRQILFFANEELKLHDLLDVAANGQIQYETEQRPGKELPGFCSGKRYHPGNIDYQTTLQAEPKSRFTLVFGNKGRYSIIFFEELEGLKNKYLKPV